MSPTNPEHARYTLSELANLAGVTPRTVRYYLAQGLLPAVGISGPGAKYDDAHLARLRVIKRLQQEHQPLADIRRQLETLDDAAVLAIAAEPAPVTPPPDSALDYIRRVTAPTHDVAEPLLRRAYAPRLMSADISASTAPPPTPDQLPDATLRLERSQWERLSLGPDVELHIRRPLPRSTSKRVDRLVEIARDLLEEDLT
jgi:DNA-binding transcriptional MerR regulator